MVSYNYPQAITFVLCFSIIQRPPCQLHLYYGSVLYNVHPENSFVLWISIIQRPPCPFICIMDQYYTTPTLSIHLYYDSVLYNAHPVHTLIHLYYGSV